MSSDDGAMTVGNYRAFMILNDILFTLRRMEIINPPQYYDCYSKIVASQAIYEGSL